ncbi:uncharacterized protein LOC125334519 [Corvus hawaiiensis]|uniref:uncharacterized protein LOC125334519 n=1 Tax=Corvus hawaiiensis TaxID=134902 RepID=UPI002018A9CB|nr:uncharacterized protein LOC125334519 [Corvus hawaiiensis]XP_048177360.1 uncharacterized protein LOC125334519 [Corvus hawaiiensis]XP_048177361.1 uncharacterized protein LOC125334519 [Corvus hawaiiensis]XP_048177363.1 uncharacterized protein LOC125334519 [Corvus hawaiiensis]
MYLLSPLLRKWSHGGHGGDSVVPTAHPSANTLKGDRGKVWVLETRVSTSFHPPGTAQSSSLSPRHPGLTRPMEGPRAKHPPEMPTAPHRWPAVAVTGGVRGHRNAQSPRGPEEGKDKLDASDSTCDLAWLPVMPAELQQVPESNLSPFHKVLFRAPWSSQHQQLLLRPLAPAALGVMAPLAGGSQSNLDPFWPHGCCTYTALPRMSLSPCHSSVGTPRLSCQLCFCLVEVQGYFFLKERATEGGNKIQGKLGGEHNIKGKEPEPGCRTSRIPVPTATGAHPLARRQAGTSAPTFARGREGGTSSSAFSF